MNPNGKNDTKKMYKKNLGIKSLKKWLEDCDKAKNSVKESSRYDDKETRAFRNKERNHGLEKEVNLPDKGEFNLAINGKVVNGKDGKPMTFNSLTSIRKAANTMMAKPFNKGKKFTSRRL
jgi:hypothetical protein